MEIRIYVTRVFIAIHPSELSAFNAVMPILLPSPPKTEISRICDLARHLIKQ